jgi:hypothetical protein
VIYLLTLIMRAIFDSSNRKIMATRFVVRETSHPAEDLKRNWSAPCGGFSTEMAGLKFNNEEDAITYYEHFFESKCPFEFRFHPAYNSFVEVHYEGLGAWELNADNISEAIEEAKKFKQCAVTMDAGSGHFCAQDVVSFTMVSEGKYIFEIKN